LGSDRMCGGRGFCVGSWLTLERCSRQLGKTGLEDRVDFGVDGDVSGRNGIDVVTGASGFGEVEEAADVVVLVVAGEQALGFGDAEVERREGYGLAKILGQRAVVGD